MKRPDCTEMIYKPGDTWRRYRCDHAAVEGSDKCGVHHPDAKKRRDEKSKQRRAADARAADIRTLRYAAQILRRIGCAILASSVDDAAKAEEDRKP